MRAGARHCPCAASTGAPIKFVGVSEKIDGLEVFHPDRMASRILGMGDVLTLIEEAHRQVDVDEAQKLAQEGQVGQGLRPRGLQGADRPDAQDGRRAGPARQVAGRARARRAGHRRSTTSAIRRLEGIINSMTPAERAKPGAAQGLAQAAYRQWRRGERAGGQPPADAVRADAENDENGGEWRYAENAARAARAPSPACVEPFADRRVLPVARSCISVI